MKSTLTIILFVLSSSVFAQQFYSKNITSPDGLPDDAIRSIYKDSRGYLWIGTDAGVSRWDGNEFITYNTLDGLAGNKVWWIDEDNKHNLWFACFGAGISKFDGQKFVSFTDKDGLTDNYARVIKYSSHHNCLAIGTNEALSILKDSVFYNFNTENKLLKKEVIITGILDNDSCIDFYDFSSMHQRIFFQDKKPYIKASGFNFIDKYGVSSVFEAIDGSKYVGWGRSGVICINESGLLKLPHIGQVFGFAEDYAHRIWIASWNGGGNLSPPGGLFVYKNGNVERLNNTYGINSILGWSLFSLKSQDLIFYGTLDKGLFKIPPPWFEYYLPEYFQENNLAVNDIEIDKENNVWFVTDSLLIKWDGNKVEKSGFDVFRQVYNDYFSTNRANRANENSTPFNDGKQFGSVVKDKSGNIWVFVRRHSLFNFPSNTFDNIKFYPLRILSDFAFDDKDTLFRVHDWLYGIEKFIDFRHSDKTIIYKDSLLPMFAKKLVKYQNEMWAFSRISGVFLEKDGVLRTVTSEDSTISKLVDDICFDSIGYAYLAGVDGKIDVLEPVTRKKVFEIYQNNNHKPVTWLKVSENRLFAGNSNELRVYKLDDIKAGKSNYQLFQESEGYKLKTINNSALDNEGNIWLATNNGLVKINTHLLSKLSNDSLITVITKVELFNKPVDWSLYSKTDPWSKLPEQPPKLSYNQNNLSIYYNTLNYNNPDGDDYYYKLEGVDKEWIGPSNKKYVVYPNLPHGKYRFLVKSKNKNSGLYSSTASFGFVITPPWYKTFLFYLIVALIVIGLFTLFYMFRMREMKSREQEKRKIMQQIAELETKALQAQMNPHFLFNSLNSIQNFILDNDVDEALEYLNSFSRIIRLTLEFVDKKFIPLSDELDYLKYYVSLEKMRFDNLFSFEVIIGDKIEPECILIPPMLLQPLIENAIKHGIMHLKVQKGEIKLEIKKINQQSFQCIIMDNGVGREISKKIEAKQKNIKRSKGLSITHGRLKMLNNKGKNDFRLEIIDLYDEDGKPTGTKVEITLPFILE